VLCEPPTLAEMECEVSCGVYTMVHALAPKRESAHTLRAQHPPPVIISRMRYRSSDV
jgi:hypothetical protein